MVGTLTVTSVDLMHEWIVVVGTAVLFVALNNGNGTPQL
jgi:hypothetical protein